MKSRATISGTTEHPRGDTACLLIAFIACIAFIATGAVLGVPQARAAEQRPSEKEIGQVQVYSTPGQALSEIFDSVAGVDTLRVQLTPEEMHTLQKTLGRIPPSEEITVYRPRGADGELLGYAVIAEEVGKYRPITFMVGTAPSLEVHGVEVLVYRESRGGEVRRSRFLRQYRGKEASDPIRLNRDILNVAGATMSVNAMNLGVKRTLLVLELLAARNAI